MRGTSGGFLFGIPLLYTMEVWQVGSIAEPPEMVVALVLTLPNQFLSGERNEGSSQQGKTKQQNKDKLNATLGDMGATLIGAAIIAFNIAPTDAIPMLSAAVSAPWLLALVVASLLISYGIVFEAGFANQRKRQQQQGIFQRPLSETIASYLGSLIGSTIMLYFFKQLSFDEPWSVGHFYVPFAVTNTGGGTAASVQVIAELRFQGKVEATGEQQFDFLSNGETEKGAFVFNRNPRDGELILRVTSYKLP